MRLFFAIEIPAELRRKTAGLCEEIKQGCPGLQAKWVPPQNMHITAVFLGEVDEARLEDLKNAARHALEGFPAFPAALNNLGVFPSRHSPRVLWIGLGEGKKELTETAVRLGQALEKTGIVFDKREPSPHLTIARFPKPPPRESLSRLLGYLERPAPALGCWQAGGVVLMKSQLASPAPIYSCIERFPLGKPE
ncbi:MAG: RNA 2',3'-cyclic phosphodiesterase [Elusimicrobia bacterium]|nr:RNA 2',3'-cyclic phosphodiesterase [Elusimicrobiota bacterium]